MGLLRRRVDSATVCRTVYIRSDHTRGGRMDTAGPVSVTDHAAERETLRSFRGGLYGCLTRRPDASFELADTLVAGGAMATAPPPHLSLEPAFRRGWGSTYGALRWG